MTNTAVATIVLSVAAATVGFWLLRRVQDRRIVSHPVRDCPPAGSAEFARTAGSLLGAAFVGGNRVLRLRDGDEIFPAMLAAIAHARRAICFETFVYWSGDIGLRFARALAERSRAGLKVNVLLDYVGSLTMDADALRLMREAGCEIVRFHPPSLLHPSRINNRTHRKLLVIDGRVGFTGGVGIGEQWTGHAQDEDHWRDTHLRVEGPVVAQLQGVFMVNWIKATGRVTCGDEYFPALPEVGDTPAHMFHSSPDDGSENVRLMYLLAIASARRSIRLAQAYFIPDEGCRRALCEAARRGVEIDILLPGRHTDSHTVRHASRAIWGELLEAGVRIHEFQPTHLHAKITLIDDVWCSLGSANFDNRSFRLNDEANLSALDPALARQLAEDFAADLRRARQITLAAWRSRPWRQKALDHLARRVRRLL
jgi:cardiolipin synthase